jgi:hypothetical protein
VTLHPLIQEFFAVISSSRKTEVSIIAAVLSPGLVLLCGAFALNLIQFEGQFEALTFSIKRGFALIFLALAAVVFVQLSVIAIRNYAKARDRLYRL